MFIAVWVPCCVLKSTQRLQNENILAISVNNIRTAVMYSPLKGTINGAPYSLFLTNVFALPPGRRYPFVYHLQHSIPHYFISFYTEQIHFTTLW